MQQLEKPPVCRIADADPNGAFASGLEYNPPVRGMWNIVHMGMLVPEAHQVYACAQGCLRGVILTAAETNQLDRLSWISLTEEDMFNGTLETSLVEGVSEIIEKIGHHPPMIPLFLSCMHLFAGCDFDSVCPENTAIAGIRKTEEFFKSLGMPISIPELVEGVTDQDLQEMTDLCISLGRTAIGGFKKLNKEDVLAIYKMANK